MITNEDIADIIEDGADYIEKNGWCQGDLYDWRAVAMNYQVFPPACFMGGLLVGNRATGGVARDVHLPPPVNGVPVPQRVPMGVLVGAIEDVEPELRGPGLSGWNDKVGRTQQEVLDKMRSLAKRIRGKS